MNANNCPELDRITAKLNNLYLRNRRQIAAPAWVKPYASVRPSEGRRMLKADVLDGTLDIREESAVRSYLKALEDAEDSGTNYPSWNEFIEGFKALDAMTEDERDALWHDAILAAFPRLTTKTNDKEND